MSKATVTLAAALASAVLMASAPAIAAQCNHPDGFDAFIADFKKEAAAQGISRRGLAALDDISFDPKVIAADRGQKVFKQSFEQFSARMISRDRMIKGARTLQRHDATLRRMEQKFGVPGPIVVAIWGLETDYGVTHGNLSVVRSAATLAFDCRRSEKFQGELAAALRIIDRGDMTSEKMRGQWAGEIGQTQFLPSSYDKYAIDFDGDGRRDLVNSPADVIGSTANYLKSHGWQRGQGWAPGEPNFAVIKEWNRADVYARTIALFAERLDAGRSKAQQIPDQPDRRARR